MKKKIGAILCVTAVATSSMFMLPGLAQDIVQVNDALYSSKDGENVKITLEQAIIITKEKLELNVDDLKFTSSYEEYDNQYQKQKVWGLNWNDESYSRSINVTINADTGDIIGYYNYNYNNDNKFSVIPKYTLDEARAKAMEFIKAIQPNEAIQVKLDEEESILNQQKLVGHQGDCYNVNFYREIDGISYKENNFNLSLNKNTLQIQNYSFNWNNESLSPIEAKIQVDEAKNIFKEKIGLELNYMLNNSNKDEKEAKLVYVPKNTKAINAVTGEIIENNYYAYGYGGFAEDINMAMDIKSTTGEVGLSEEELKQIDIFDQFITKEEAIKIALEYLDSDCELSNSGLSKYDDFYVWNLNWQRENKDNDYKYQYATINASTGEIINFNKYSKNDYNKDVKYTEEQCKEIADKFLNKIQPNKINNLRYQKPEKISEYNDNETNTFNYYRTYNDIKVPFNNIVVTVNAITGNIESYHLNWFEFKDLSTVEDKKLTLEEVYNVLFSKIGLDLKYINVQLNKENEIHLVYGLNKTPIIIDAVNGTLLDNNLKEIKEEVNIEFKDIANHWAKNDINKLAELGIIDKEEFFNPTANVKQIDVIKFIINGLYNNEKYNNMKDEDYYKMAINLNIITKEEKVDAEIKRIDVAKMIINSLNVSSVAKLSDSVFVNDFLDVSNENLGYISIINGFEIMKGSDNKFYPNDIITKGEVAAIILRTMEVKSK